MAIAVCGLELDYQALNRIDYVDSAPGFNRPAIGGDGSRNLGIGLGVLYDDIHNAMNPRAMAFYSEWAFLRYGAGTGSDFELHLLHRQTPASTARFGRIRSSPPSSTASSPRAMPPFNMLSLLGGESLMRGYYLGRFRDRNHPRRPGRVPHPAVFLLQALRRQRLPGRRTGLRRRPPLLCGRQFLPTGGAGLRFLLFPEKDIYTRLDVAFTREGSGVYFFIGEAF